MKKEAFILSMQEKGLAEKTVYMRANALLRVERYENVDLDEEFDRDGMVSLLNRFTYGAADEQSGRPNPTQINIGSRSLRTVLAWYKSHLNQYRKFLMTGDTDDIFEPDQTEDDFPTDESPTTFGLEADLQSALRDSIEQLEPGLQIVDGGAERKVASGFIDILAQDTDGTFVIVELKAGTARDAVVAQILGYMGDIAEETGTRVRGIIVAGDFRPRVESAARAIPNLKLKTYRYKFEFS